LSDLQITSSSVPTIWCNNLGATYLFVKPIFHARTKHDEVDYYFIRDKVAKKVIQVLFISSKD
jgi:histone deacetylase 1/2